MQTLRQVIPSLSSTTEKHRTGVCCIRDRCAGNKLTLSPCRQQAQSTPHAVTRTTGWRCRLCSYLQDWTCMLLSSGLNMNAAQLRVSASKNAQTGQSTGSAPHLSLLKQSQTVHELQRQHKLQVIPALCKQCVHCVGRTSNPYCSLQWQLYTDLKLHMWVCASCMCTGLAGQPAWARKAMVCSLIQGQTDTCQLP